MARMAAKIGEREFIFRIPDIQDLTILDGEIPILPTEQAIEEDDPEAAFERVNRDPDMRLKMLRRWDRLLLLTCLQPRLVAEPQVEERDDVVCVRDLRSPDRMAIALNLLSQSGWNEEAAVEIRPLSAANGCLSGHTTSPVTSEGDPAITSADG